VVVLLSVPAEAQFKQIRRAVDREIGGNRLYIPLTGLARLFVRAAQPEGVHDFQFAIYENARAGSRGKIEAIFKKHLGPGWQPFVRVANHREGEEVLIYAHEGDGGETIDLMIFAGERDESVLMLTTLHIDRFVEGLDDPEGFAAR
jgi:hypothetical protein